MKKIKVEILLQMIFLDLRSFMHLSWTTLQQITDFH